MIFLLLSIGKMMSQFWSVVVLPSSMAVLQWRYIRTCMVNWGRERVWKRENDKEIDGESICSSKELGKTVDFLPNEGNEIVWPCLGISILLGGYLSIAGKDASNLCIFSQYFINTSKCPRAEQYSLKLQAAIKSWQWLAKIVYTV